MRAAARPYVMASAVLAAASASRRRTAAVAAPHPQHRDPSGRRHRLHTQCSDKPVRRHPQYSVQRDPGLDTFGEFAVFGGTWWVPSPTNIWGIDPGDPTHSGDSGFLGAVPGVGSTATAAWQAWASSYGLLAAELPVSAGCDAATCAPRSRRITSPASRGRPHSWSSLANSAGQTHFRCSTTGSRCRFRSSLHGYYFNLRRRPRCRRPPRPGLL